MHIISSLEESPFSQPCRSARLLEIPSVPCTQQVFTGDSDLSPPTVDHQPGSRQTLPTWRDESIYFYYYTIFQSNSKTEDLVIGRQMITMEYFLRTWSTSGWPACDIMEWVSHAEVYWWPVEMKSYEDIQLFFVMSCTFLSYFYFLLLLIAGSLFNSLSKYSVIETLS